MTVMLGPTWAYEQRDKLLRLARASVEWVMGRYFNPDTVLRDIWDKSRSLNNFFFVILCISVTSY